MRSEFITSQLSQSLIYTQNSVIGVVTNSSIMVRCRQNSSIAVDNVVSQTSEKDSLNPFFAIEKDRTDLARVLS